MLTIITAPSATTTFSGISEWASPLFNDLWPFANIIIGVFVGIFIIGWLIRAISGAFHGGGH